MTMHWRKINSVTGATPPSRLDSLDLGRGFFLQALIDVAAILAWVGLGALFILIAGVLILWPIGLALGVIQ
jgi:hypothetical protein